MEIYIADLLKERDVILKLLPLYMNNAVLCLNEKKLASLTGELIVRRVIEEKHNIDLKLISIEKGKMGKPYIKQLPEFHYNISHSGNIVAVAVDDNPVGIDTEKIKYISLKHSRKIFTECENEYIFKDSKDREKRFLEIWTKKEAIAKQKGRSILTEIRKKEEIDAPVYTFEYEKNIISVCSSESIEAISITHLSELFDCI